jgi:phage RecT family recombinase
MANDLVAHVCTTIQTPEFKSKLAQALPPGVSVDRFTRVTLTAIQQNPAVVNGDRASLYNAVTRCAQDGLLPDGKQAALVMFGNAVQYMPMIGGLRNIAAKHGIAMATGVVHKNDSFEYELGIEPRMVHKRSTSRAANRSAHGLRPRTPTATCTSKSWVARTSRRSAPSAAARTATCGRNGGARPRARPSAAGCSSRCR